MSDTAGPAREGASAPPLILPQELRDDMYPDDRIIWMQRGHGARWPLVYAAPPVLIAIGMTFAIWLLVKDRDGLEALGAIVFLGVFLLGCLFVVSAGAIGIIFGPSSEYYVLTDDRVLHHRSAPTHSTRALSASGAGSEADLGITHIAVWGRRDRGWIMLRSDTYQALPFQSRLQRWPFPHYVTSLVGVENPLQVAALIKSTLALDFEIEDHTR